MEYYNSGIQEQTDRHNALNYPWRRFFARALDLSIYQSIWLVFQYLVLRWHTPNGFFISLFISYIVLGIMLVVEPLLLSTWGSTPGKAIMGLVVRNTDGSKLSYAEGIERTFGVFAVGYGWGIPIYNLARLWKCHTLASEQGMAMEWDTDLHYSLSDARSRRAVLTLAAYGAVFILGTSIILQGHMPKYRGDLTAAKYAANVNDVIARPKISPYGFSQRMTEQGTWVSNERAAGTFVPPQGNQPAHILQIEDGLVTGVSFEVTSTANSLQGNRFTQKYIMLVSFMGAQKDIKPLMLVRGTKFRQLDSMESYIFEVAGVRITNDIEYRGYMPSSEWLIPTEGEEQYFRMVFSMEKIQ